MQRIILAITAMVMTLTAAAYTVTHCQAGQLALRVDDCDITSLEVQGYMDARDFRFIADSLRQLTQLDLSQTSIQAYKGESLFANVSEYAANQIPPMSLASMLELTTVKLPNTVVALCDGCMSGCPQLSVIELPSSLTHIGDYAFSGCERLTQVNVGMALERIGDGAFSNCPILKTIQLAQSSLDMTSTLASATLHIGNRAFANCPQLETLSLTPLGSMGNEALAETGLTHLDLSKETQLDTLPDWALSNTSLTQLALPPHLRVIGQGALMNDNALTQFTLPATLRHIDSYAMAYMTGLQQIESKPTQVPTLGDSVWYGVEQNKVKLNVSPQSLNDYRLALQWCNFLIGSLQNGDVNGDGSIDIADVNILINIMLGRDNADNYDGRAYVTAGDTEVDIADVNAVINIMVGKARALRKAAEEAAKRAQQTTHAATPTAIR